MKVISAALLSYGLSGKVFHAPFLVVGPGFRLTGAWERSKQQIEQDHPGTRSYNTLDEILSDPEVELIVVNTPTYTHFDFATRALEAGKHVVVEKAFTTTAAEALQLEKLAVERGRVLSVYHNRRWDSDFLAVQQVIRDGGVGEVVEAQIGYDRFNPELSPKAHREMPGPGAGNLMDLGPHCIDEALVLFGMPESVFADLRSCRKGSQVDDYFEVLLYYPNLRVRLHSSYLVRKPGPGFVIHGRKGTFLKNRSDVQESQLRRGMKPDSELFGIEPITANGKLYREGVEEAETLSCPRGNYGHFYDQLYRAIVSGEPPPVTAAEGVNVMRILDAAFESQRTRAVVSI